MQELDIDLGNGFRWLRLETVEDGMLAQDRNGTAVGHYFERELKLREQGKPANEYFALIGADGSIPVAVQVWHDPEVARAPRSMVERNIVVGYQNRNPFPEHEARIEALGGYLGRELGPWDYPYGGRRREDEPASPAP